MTTNIHINVKDDLKLTNLPKKQQYLYLIEAPDQKLVKIGISVHPDVRFKQLCGESPVKLNLVAVQMATEEDERAAHRLCSNYHSHGEWFHDNEEIRMLFK